MKMPVEKWYNAIQLRRSRRQFVTEPISRKTVDHLVDFSAELNHFIEGARVVFVTENPDKVFKGAIGSYGKIKSAPAYAAFIGDTQNPNIQEKVGYLGECFILEATSIGLATCWVGGFFKPEVVANQIRVGESEKALAVSPVGYASKEYNLEEKIMSGLASSQKRKGMDSLCHGLNPSEWSNWIRSALEAARLSQSAVNRQPWQFVIEKDSIMVSVDNLNDSHDISKRLDCGIAMLHLEIGALHEGIQGYWEYLDPPDVARFKC